MNDTSRNICVVTVEGKLHTGATFNRKTVQEVCDRSKIRPLKFLPWPPGGATEFSSAKFVFMR